MEIPNQNGVRERLASRPWRSLVCWSLGIHHSLREPFDQRLLVWHARMTIYAITLLLYEGAEVAIPIPITIETTSPVSSEAGLAAVVMKRFQCKVRGCSKENVS